MVQILPKHKFSILALFLFSLVIEGGSHKFSRSLSQRSYGFKREKLSHLQFYLHDLVSGDHPTAVRVAEAAMTNTSRTLFGATHVIDDSLTVGPEPTSKIVGRAQGIYAFTDLNEFGLLMVFNYAFVEGKYNGSTLSVLGKNSFLSKVREMPIVGGSGLFRFARGYVLATTHSLNLSSGDAVVKHDVYVLHY
ncbi:dirigent protein 21-like [Cynara cardunculus var. scolymus]|nr:dirigent protein 21-like [Cynara cardunculus var. scolymus]